MLTAQKKACKCGKHKQARKLKINQEKNALWEGASHVKFNGVLSDRQEQPAKG
jgi:hypothetical protein